MSGERRSYRTYAVHVSRLHRETKEDELYELFKHCGPISGTYIADHVQGTYVYGFVRFADPKAALTAVREVDQWSLKGRTLKVELSTDTRLKLVAEGHLENTQKPRVKHAPPTRQGEMTRMSMDSLLSESRLRDSCTEINLQKGNRLDVEKLMADINKQKCHKTCVLHGDLIGQQLKTISQIKKKLLKSEADGRIPTRTTDTFFETLENILENVVSIAQEDDDLQTSSAPASGTEGTGTQQRRGKQTTFVKHLMNAIRKTKGLSPGLEEKMASASDLNESQSGSNLSCSERTCGVSSGEHERRNYIPETAMELEKSITSDQNEGGGIESGDFKQSHVKQKQAGLLSERDGWSRNGVINVKRNHSNIHVQSLLKETRKSAVSDTKKSERNDTPKNVVDATRNTVINDNRICSPGRSVLDAVAMGQMSDPDENTKCRHSSLSDVMNGSSDEDSSDSSFSSDSERNRLFLRYLGCERGHCSNADTSSSNQDTSESECSTSEFETVNHNICVEQGMMSKSDNCEKLKDSDHCEKLTAMLKNMLHIPTNDGSQTKAVIDSHVNDFHVDPQSNQTSYSSLPANHQSPVSFRNSSVAMGKLTNTSSSISPNHSLATPSVTNEYKYPIGRGLSSILVKLRSKERRPGTCLPDSEKHALHNNSAEYVDLSYSDYSHVDCPYDDCGGDALLCDSRKEVWTSNFVEAMEDQTVTVRQRNARPKARPQRVLGSSTQSQPPSQAELKFEPLKVLECNRLPHHNICQQRTQPKPHSSSVLSSQCHSVAENHIVAKPTIDPVSLLQGCSKSASSETESDVLAVDSGVESDSYQRILSGRRSQETARSAANGVVHSSKDSNRLQLYIKQVVGRGRGLQLRFQ